MEQELDKNEILEAYLNAIYFGAGNYGIKEAAKYYFNKTKRYRCWFKFKKSFCNR